MADLPGDPNWLLSTVVLASTLILVLHAIFIASRSFSTAGERRTLELRRMEVGTAIRLGTLRLNRLEAELAAPPLEGSDSRRAQASAEHELAVAELAARQAEEDLLQAALRNVDNSRRGWFNVLVIGYLAAIGILLPMALMPARSASLDPAAVWSLAGLELSGSSWRRLVLAGFAGGLGLSLLEMVRVAVARKGADSLS